MLRAREVWTKESQSREGVCPFCTMISTTSPLASAWRSGTISPFTFAPGALMAHFGVDGIGEIDGRGAARQHHHAPLGRERVDLFGIEIDAQRRKKLARLLHLLHPLDQVAHPDDALIVGRGCRFRAAILVFPVRGHALFGDAMHLLRANLHLEGLPGMNHGGVQRLVEVRPRHGDVILESPGNGTPYLMDHAERRITILHRVGNHAHGEQVVDLIERPLLLLNLLVQRIEALDAGLHFGGNAVLDQLAANRVLHFDQKLVEDLLLGRDFLLQLEKRFRLEIAERKIFEFAANEAHSEPVGDRRVDIERFAGDALLLLANRDIRACACCAGGRPASPTPREHR